MKRIITILLAVIMVLGMLASCTDKGGNTPTDTSSADTQADNGEAKELETDANGRVKLTFAESINYATIEAIEGKTVVMTGYMATISPVSGKFMYLMNLPYQSCPYCVPNTTQLSNTIAVYAPDGKKFDFTDSPIEITGRIETGNFKDEFDYTYKYRIVDASYKIVDSSEASEKLTLWQKISDDGLSADVYAMFDYVDFMCRWPTYTAQFEEGTAYLYPADVAYFQGSQYKKESAADYFTSLCDRAKAIDSEKLSELCTIIEDAEKLVAKAQKQIDDGNYSYDQSSDTYALTYGEEMSTDAQNLYYRYATWLEMFSLSN